jgi:hypothetical protein
MEPPVRLALAFSLAASFAVLPAAALGDDTAQCVRGMAGRAPPPVAAFVRREQTCMRWNGDEAMDAKTARSPRTPKRIRELNCDRLAHDEEALRNRYARDHAAMSALDESDKTLC